MMPKYPISAESRYRIVKLRDNPLIHYLGKRSWPPVWIQSINGSTTRTYFGEDGILERVRFHEVLPGRLFLKMSYNRRMYTGCLFLEPSAAMCVLRILQRHIGKTISEVGDIDTSELL